MAQSQHVAVEIGRIHGLSHESDVVIGVMYVFKQQCPHNALEQVLRQHTQGQAHLRRADEAAMEF